LSINGTAATRRPDLDDRGTAPDERNQWCRDAAVRETRLLPGDSVVSNNRVLAGTGGGIQADDAVEVTHVTLTKNSGGVEHGGAIGPAGIVSLANSVILRNVSPDCATIIRSGGGNIANEPLCLTGLRMRLLRPDDLWVPRGPLVEATLDPVPRNNGGRTPTHALPPGSRAINFAGSGLAIDQRGMARQQLGRFDSGAYESTAPSWQRAR
jgi:hypothetical protein